VTTVPEAALLARLPETTTTTAPAAISAVVVIVSTLPTVTHDVDELISAPKRETGQAVVASAVKIGDEAVSVMVSLTNNAVVIPKVNVKLPGATDSTVLVGAADVQVTEVGAAVVV
jgi:hypothetical protein